MNQSHLNNLRGMVKLYRNTDYEFLDVPKSWLIEGGNYIDLLEDRITKLEEKAALYDQLIRACGELPEGWEIVIELENGAGTVSLFDPEYREIEYDDDHECITKSIEYAIDFAVANSKL